MTSNHDAMTIGSILDVSQALYLNVPRLAAIAGTHGIELRGLDIPDAGLHAMRGNLAGAMLALGSVLHDVRLEVTVVRSMKEIRKLPPGTRIVFEHALRTRGILAPADGVNSPQEPFVYWHTKTIRLVMPVDLRWVTFSSAFSHLRPAGGKIRLAGIASIVGHEHRQSTASLLALGMPNVVMVAVNTT